MRGAKADRSRSPNRTKGGGRRRERNQLDGNHVGDMSNAPMMNQQMMMPNMMMGQGNMMMPNMYGNMMMPNMMEQGMMGGPPMEMMQQPPMEMMPQPPMEMAMGPGGPGPPPPLPPGPPPMEMDMSMMGGMMMDPTMMGNMGNMGNMGMFNMDPGDMSMDKKEILLKVPATRRPPSQPGPLPGMDMSMMGGIMMDPSMMANMGNMAMYNMDQGDMSMDKREIVLKNCKLTPPPPGVAVPAKRVKPLGCRTIFVGGLPEGIRETIVREVFENYGRINTLRLSIKNFCHIRFERESCVDAAMMISGYRIKLLCDGVEEEEDTKQNSGWLHVDYALSRDDQNEFERRQRQALRQQESQMQLAQQPPPEPRWRSPSPPRVQPFSGGAIPQLCEKVKSEEHFAGALSTLIAWLERGECSKRNASQFYSMIQATNSHIRRLFNEKMAAEEEFHECKERVKSQLHSIIEQLEQVAKVFKAATHQRVWDHFTKPQRKNIETWQKMAQEFSTLKEEFTEKFCDDGNESYNNGFNMKPLEIAAPGNSAGLTQLKMENDSLKFQLEAYKNEVEVIKADATKELEKFKAQFIARQALQGAFDNKPTLPPPPLSDNVEAKVLIRDPVESGCGEARLIGVMAAFLQVHPQGASLDYVVSYVRALFPHVSQATIHHVLQKHAEVFQRSTSGVGANIEHRWSFVAFDTKDIKKDT